ncbi:MAG: ATPase, T2SS/T4P/T4SS family [Phycisphaerae bacterium]
MPELLLAAAELGGYISIIKLVIFLIMFFLWIPILGWVSDDAQMLHTKDEFWSTILLAVGILGAVIWLLIPMFIVGLAIYVMALAGVSISYVMHRNSLVSEFERVLTVNHIKDLFVNHEKKLSELRDIGFISAHGNEIPLPEPKSADFFSFKIAHSFFKNAQSIGTNNIILSPAAEGYNLVYIVDGAQLEQPSIGQEQVDRLSEFLKELASLDVDERRKPQKGTFRLREGNDVNKWEVTTAGSTAGEHIKLHKIIQESIPKLEEINLLPEQYQQLSGIREVDKGLFLISGPKESGVTTTLYALLRSHDAFLNNIYTLEYKLSGQLPNITQEVFSLSDTGTTTYGKKLLSIARMSPDVLGVVEVKDSETARVACMAAKEGATVYATIEADTTVNALTKWIKLVGDRNLALGPMIGASNQRLFRKLCDQCKQAYEPNKELLKKFNIPPEKVKVLYRVGKVYYDKRGKAYPCDACHEIGFHGRECSFEIIMINDQIKKALAQAKSSQDIALLLRSAKMRYLQEVMLDKVLNGTTSINEMIRVLSSPKQAGQKPEVEE